MDNKLLLEGAVAGHMNHIYDNGEITFGELKQLIQAISDGKVRGTEKTDGQNIFLSFDVRTQKAKAIRNKGHIKAGGLDIETFDEFFSDHPSQALRYSFVEALQTFEQTIKQLDKSVQEKIFGPGSDKTDIYFNTEVMNPGTQDLDDGDPRGQGTTNVIPYDKKTLLIHRVGHSMFLRETAKVVKDGNDIPIDVTPNYDALEQAIAGLGSDDPSVFSVETNPIRKLSPLDDKDVVSTTIENIDNLVRDQGLNDTSTINNYVISQVVPIIDQFGLTEDKNKLILKRLMMPTGGPTKKQIFNGIPVELADKIRSFIDSFKYAEFTRSLQNILHNFSVAAIDGMESAFISDNKKQIKFLQSELQKSIIKIQNSSNERAKEELVRQMEKLKSFKGINTPSEGFVFNWNDVTYKLTGNFAPANQILGMERFQRFGPIEPSEEGENATQATNEPLTVAILPGSFKPPHKGHRIALETIAMGGPNKDLPDADKVYVIISSPMMNSRPLPESKKIISAEEAKQMWQVMLEGSPIANKTQLIIANQRKVTPVSLTIDYVTKPADPTNVLIAPPNSNVILGVGDKEGDAKRFKGLRNSVEKNRPDIELLSGVVPVVEHDKGYIEFLEREENEFIKSKMKSNYKAFNASDMRFLLDFATQDPVGIELLNYFLPNGEGALAYMGIMGLNPADKRAPEDDQVKEPSVDSIEAQQDPLQEIIQKEAILFYEDFRKQTAPKGKKSNEKFQTNMRRRLSKAHATYLDMGRHDLTKHGGGFHLDRPKDISNAFLAEEEVEENTMGGGSIEGGGNGFVQTRKQREDDETMLKQEKRLRKKIRISLREFFNYKANEHESEVNKILEEHKLRLELRNIIFEQSVSSLNEAEDPSTDVHDNTGINTLKDLMKNTNVLATLRETYKTLTTDSEQKQSFRAHIIKWVQDTLAPVKLNDTSATNQVAEQVGVDIEGIETDKFIDVDDGSEKDLPGTEDDDEEDKMGAIEGEDTTGRNKAERVYPSIEKSIIDFYSELDNPEDQEMFYDYLIANLKLYFDKWDNEMSVDVEEPTNDAYDQQAGQDAAAV